MSIYKDCDIRGIYGEEFGAEEMRLVGRAIGRRLDGRSIVVAGDVRTSTPAIKERLLAGLKEEGAHIIDIGTAPTPVAYFAKSRECFDAYALAIVTASHNPAKYNGVKLMFGDFPPTPDEIRSIEAEVKAERQQETGLQLDADANQQAGQLLENGSQQEVGSQQQEAAPQQEVGSQQQTESAPAQASGAAQAAGPSSQYSYVAVGVEDKYFAFMSRLIKGNNGLKVVLDIGNGTTAGIAPRLYRAMGYEVVELFGEADGSFPNRNPNPADFRNLDAVRARVLETGADFGVAFDGDGDRAVFIDNKGRAVINEKSLIMLAEHATGRSYGGAAAADPCGAHPQFSIVYDQKCSRIVPKAIKAMGGRAILERSGHAFIKKTFLEHGSILAGEISGHFFFRELGHDDGIYAGLCMGDFLASHMTGSVSGTGSGFESGSVSGSESGFESGAESGTISGTGPTTLADLADRMPDPHISPDLRYRVPYDKMDGVLAGLKAHYEELRAPISTYDGVRVELDDGWLLVRKSVTEEAMTAKIEAGSGARIEEIRKELERDYFSL